MKYLLETHTLLWSLQDSSLLSAAVRECLTAPGQSFYASAASAWEIATKHRAGKLAGVADLVAHFEDEMGRAGALLLPVTCAHALKARSFPQGHRDPFDRILAAQAKLEDMVLLSKDTQLDAFGPRRMW